MGKWFLGLFWLVSGGSLNAQTKETDSVWIVSHYRKMEQMIPMRDGISLYTSIYIPTDDTELHPFLIERTPYSAGPYGNAFSSDAWESYHSKYFREHYIMVIQDVRGRYMSQGDYMDVRPFNPHKTGVETDEASDTYDTIDWLVKNIKGNNGKAGVFGISYPGFYSTMAALSGHPALKAVSPQAPVTDWFTGDDFHHYGAFMLMDAFAFYSGFGVPRPSPVAEYNKGFQIRQKDKYRFYLNAGPLPAFNKKFLGDSIAFWNQLMEHAVYDDWWKARNPRNYVELIKPAMLVVGGLFDAEDLFGAWNLYKAIEHNIPSGQFNKIIMGPWFHGAWAGRSEGAQLGKVHFGSQTSKYYQDSLEFPFFQYQLKGVGSDLLPEATIFFSGENRWRTFNQWPPARVSATPIFLQPRGKLSFSGAVVADYVRATDSSSIFTSYKSNPKKPVPYQEGLIKTRTTEYMAADQRFTKKRRDVIRFETPVLKENLTLAGPVIADLIVSVTGTDADFVVKVIDVFPNDIASNGHGADTIYYGMNTMNGYRMLVRGEIMRGKFRNSLTEPVAFLPGKKEQVRFQLPDVAHTFLAGHRLMIEIQSSWFPLADRNPQTFTNIYKAKPQDFRESIIKVYHTPESQSTIILPILK